jgi:hypothetical protein
LHGYVAVVSPEAMGLARAARGGSVVPSVVAGACERMRVVIFGRGADANENIQMGSLLGAAWGSGDVVAYVEDDDEWAGLPAAIQRSTEDR